MEEITQTIIPGSAQSSTAQSWSYGLEVSPNNTLEPLLARMIYVSLENKVYYLHVDTLTRSSGVLRDLFALPSLVDQEGSSAENPFILDCHAPAEQWHVFLSFAYRKHHTDCTMVKYDQKHWLNMLAFAHKYDVPWALRKAKVALEQVSLEEDALSPALQLHLGRCYNFDDWVQRSVPLVVATPISKLDEDDYVYLGRKTLRKLIILHNKLLTHRHNIVRALPPRLNIHSGDCSNQSRCTAAWRQACDKITSALFRDIPISEHSILGLLRNHEYETASMTTMNATCAERIVRASEKGLSGRDVEETAKTIADIITMKDY